MQVLASGSPFQHYRSLKQGTPISPMTVWRALVVFMKRLSLWFLYGQILQTIPE